VLERGERLRRLAADALGGAVGRDELGVPALQLTQLALQGVVGLVGDLGTVQGVVEPLVAPDLGPQRLDTLAGLRG